MAQTIDEVKERYQKHLDLPIATHYFKGDGQKEEWEIDYIPTEVIVAYVVERTERDQFPVPIRVYECDTVFEGHVIKINPVIPYDLTIQIDYWFNPSSGS